MKKYDWQAAVEALKGKGLSRYKCSVCGSRNFSVPGEFATVMASSEFKVANLGAHIPAAILICKKCGHIDLFALAALDLLPKEAD